MITKEVIRQHWDNEPCGTRSIPYPVGSLDYFEAIAERRDRLVPFIADYAQFGKWKGRKVLEVGCGIGSELVRFAEAGAIVTGIDLSPKSVFLARERMRLYKCQGVTVIEADAENIPYKDNVFDFAYSFGVLHHTPNIMNAISEIYRVLKPEGQVCIMLYHRPSIVTLQMWLMFGLLKGKLSISIEDILSNHHESLGTKAFSVGETYQMFSGFQNVTVDTCVTSYDLRYWRDRYLPMWMGKIIPKSLGWNIIVRGRKI